MKSNRRSRPQALILVAVLSAGLVAFQNCGEVQGLDSLADANLNNISIPADYVESPSLDGSGVSMPLSAAGSSTSAVMFQAVETDVDGASVTSVKEVLEFGFRYVISKNNEWVSCLFHPGGSQNPGSFGTAVISYMCALSNDEVNGEVADRVARGLAKIYALQQDLGITDIAYSSGYYSVVDEIGSLSCTEPLGINSSCYYSKH